MRLLEPIAPILLDGRVKRGKERAERTPERLGRTHAARPAGDLVWLHGASVGESRLLLDVFADLRARRPSLSAVVTTQTLTAADMIAAAAAPGVLHQMAPIDSPAAVGRFLDHWRPALAVFAEGEIWPNMLAALRRRAIPAALVNARMTTKSLHGWDARRASARKVFSAFRFIGAADAATASGLSEMLARPITVIGNLKRTAAIDPPDQHALAPWRAQIGGRPVILAASTHPGEDEFALAAFAALQADHPDALLIIAPRHPDRGPAIAALASGRGYATQLRSADSSIPSATTQVLVADTMGELLLWFALSPAVYLGGATAPDVGGHNAIEPAALGRRAFTGPNGYNFREVFDALVRAGALVIGETPEQLAAHWRAELARSAPHAFNLYALFADARAPVAATIDALIALLPQEARAHA
jgi:3-deoxy-D-manno-octulosonic-acid transferase